MPSEGQALREGQQPGEVNAQAQAAEVVGEVNVLLLLSNAGAHVAYGPALISFRLC